MDNAGPSSQHASSIRKRGRPPKGYEVNPREGPSKLQQDMLAVERKRRERVRTRLASTLSVSNFSWNAFNTVDHAFLSSLESLMLVGITRGTVDGANDNFDGLAASRAISFIADIAESAQDGRKVRRKTGSSSVRSDPPAETSSDKILKRFYKKNLASFTSVVCADLCKVLDMGTDLAADDIDKLFQIGHKLVNDSVLQSSSPQTFLAVITPPVLLSAGLAHAAQVKLGVGLSTERWCAIFESIYTSWMEQFYDSTMGIGRGLHAGQLTPVSAGRDSAYAAISTPMLLRIIMCILPSTGFRGSLQDRNGSTSNTLRATAEQARHGCWWQLQQCGAFHFDLQLWKQFALVLHDCVLKGRKDVKDHDLLGADVLAKDILYLGSSTSAVFDQSVESLTSVLSATRSKLGATQHLHLSIADVISVFSQSLTARGGGVEYSFPIYENGQLVHGVESLRTVLDACISSIGSIMEVGAQLAAEPDDVLASLSPQNIIEATNNGAVDMWLTKMVRILSIGAVGSTFSASLTEPYKEIVDAMYLNRLDDNGKRVNRAPLRVSSRRDRPA